MDPARIADGLSAVTDFVIDYATTWAAAGTVAMALLEAWKGLFHTRERFHADVLERWFGGERLEPKTRARAYRELLHLTTAKPLSDPERAIARIGFRVHPDEALFAMELEKMMGQIQTAADAALDNPTMFDALYEFLTRGADEGDVTRWKIEAKETRTPVADPEGPPSRLAARAEATACYTRLRNFIRCRLDAVQLSASFRWRRMNQLWGCIVGIAILFASIMTSLKPGERFEQLPLAILASLLGGLASPVAKDLVMALKRARTGV